MPTKLTFGHHLELFPSLRVHLEGHIPLESFEMKKILSKICQIAEERKYFWK